MKTTFLLALLVTAVLVESVVRAQLRITSFNSGGQLAWTNSAKVGAYHVEWANSLLGPWNAFASPTNLNSIWVRTNRVTVEVPVSNSVAFYRVGWSVPEALGTWDYRGYDPQGTLVVTGKLILSSRTLLTGNPPTYGYSGWREVKYAGPPTNQIGTVGYQVGTGGISGRLDIGYAQLSFSWPTNCIDCESGLSGTIWPNAFTGSWFYSSFAGPISGGAFNAQKR
jgi:hypothetical protein